MYIYRAACTDKTWQDPSCPKSCSNDPRSETTWETLVSCNSTNTFCCQRSVPEGDCCCQPSTQFDLGFDPPVDVLSALRTHAANTSMGVNSTVPELQKIDSSSSSSTPTVAVGVVLGALLAAALALNVWQAQSRRRYKRLALIPSEPSRSQSTSSRHVASHGVRSIFSSGGARSVFSSSAGPSRYPLASMIGRGLFPMTQCHTRRNLRCRRRGHGKGGVGWDTVKEGGGKEKMVTEMFETERSFLTIRSD